MNFDNVAWGYSAIFKDIIERLERDGVLGKETTELRKYIVSKLERGGKRELDHVIYRFLLALNPENYWMFRMPGLFRSVVETGFWLASVDMDYGKAFFSALGRGDLGGSPAYVEEFVRHVKKLGKIDERFIYAFITGYRKLFPFLSPEEVDIYIDETLRLFMKNKEEAIDFLAGEHEQSQEKIRVISTQVLLKDMNPFLERLYRIITGAKANISLIKLLLADHPDRENKDYKKRLIFLSNRSIYLPERMNLFSERSLNRSVYLLLIVVAAMFKEKEAFSVFHGGTGDDTLFADAGELLGTDTLSLNMFQLVDTIRIINAMIEAFGGTKSLIKKLLVYEIEHESHCGMAGLAYDFLFNSQSAMSLLTQKIRETISELSCSTSNALELAERIKFLKIDDKPNILIDTILPPPVFVPFYNFRFVKSNLSMKVENALRYPRKLSHSGNGEVSKESGKGEGYYYYDEWNQRLQRYELDYCRVEEIRVQSKTGIQIPSEIAEKARETAYIFEHLKPQWPSREKLLEDGELIDHDRLVDFIVRKTVEPSPRIDFYQKNIIKKRDVAVLILMDISSSTEEEIETPAGKLSIIEIEKKALLTLAAGLERLGDIFSLCGFSGKGRLGCEFFVYKDFYEKHNESTVGKLISATPRSATRIGAALRHAGFLIRNIQVRQKIIILITDGRPRDSEYDFKSGYAQYDVRAACLENLRKGIKVVGISTNENSISDMEIMFPQKRFVILPGMKVLPDVLAMLYLRMTF